jgi:hypothetical protein
MKVGSSRVFTIKFRAGPSNEPDYHQMGAAGTISWGQGDITDIEIPSDTIYNDWIKVDSYQVSADRATTTIQIFMTEDRSDVFNLARIRCPFDVQVHMGNCEDPRDFDLGWQKILVFEDARATSWDTNEVGGLQGDAQASIMEDLPISARSVYEILRMTYRSVANTEVGEVVVSVSVCDRITCGECENVSSSDGCQRVIALTNSAGSSPGLKPQLIITVDQFGTAAIIERWITTFTIGDNASDGDCVGSNYVAISSDGENIHYANTDDIENSAETWAVVTTGIVAGKGPNAMWNYSPLLTYIAGLGGYVYIMKNPADGLTVVDAGSAVTDDLQDIHGYDTENISAVGDAGAWVYSTDGNNFNAGTAPAGPTDLTAVAYRKRNEIWVGGDDGNLYVTTNLGTNWTTKAVPGSLTQIDKIVWASETVGFVLGRTATPAGKILRTVNGGYSWYVVPEAAGLSIPANDYLLDAAVCDKEPNKLFAGGLADNGSDGILIKGSD